MKIIAVKLKDGNFGDGLNQVLWHQLLPNLDEIRDDHAIMGIGTMGVGIEKNAKPLPPSAKTIHVFGSGAYEFARPDLIDERFKFHFVRGPLTGERWGCPEKALVDGAALIMHSPLKDVPAAARTLKVGYIPHHFSDRCANFESICQMAGLKFIGTAGTTVEEFIAKVKSCDLIITEALHGSIIADLFRKPWLPVTSGRHIYDFKWQDWFRSVEVQHEFHKIRFVVTNSEGLPLIKRWENACKRAAFAVGIGRSRWEKLAFRLDGHEAEVALAAQLAQLRDSGHFILSSDQKHDQVVSRAIEVWDAFAREIK